MIVAASDDNGTNETLILQPASFSLPTINYPLLWGDYIIQGGTVSLQVKKQGRLLEIQEKGRSSLSLFLIERVSFHNRKQGRKMQIVLPISLLVFSNCDTCLSKSTSFSFPDNFPSNLPQTGSTLSSHMLYIASAPSWWPNLLQKPSTFPSCLPSWHLLAAHYPSQTILPTLKSLETPLQAGSLLPRLIRSLHPHLTGWVWSSGEQLGKEFHIKEAKP